MGRIYIVLPPVETVSPDWVDFSFSPSDLEPRESSFCFIHSRTHAPSGAPVLEWSDAIRRFIKQLD